MSKARRWPLMIDPQGQAAKFIRSQGDAKFEGGMDVLKPSDDHFMISMEKALSFGRWVLLEDVGEVHRHFICALMLTWRCLQSLDPVLESVLTLQLSTVGSQPHLKLGDKMVPFNDQFRLYMTTKLPNPHYAPELQVKVTLLNFTITPMGLQDQMLGIVVAKENPAMEQKKNELLVQSAAMKKQLKDIEDQILRLLADSQVRNCPCQHKPLTQQY